MRGSRTERVAEQLRQILSEILLYKVRDPDVGLSMITKVIMSGDLGHARVFVSVLGSEADRERAMHALRRASSFVRVELASAVNLRRVPDLSFHPDSGLEHSARIHESLRELGLVGDSAPEEDDPGSDTSGDPEPPAEQGSGSQTWRKDEELGGGE